MATALVGAGLGAGGADVCVECGLGELPVPARLPGLPSPDLATSWNPAMTQMATSATAIAAVQFGLRRSACTATCGSNVGVGFSTGCGSPPCKRSYSAIR